MSRFFRKSSGIHSSSSSSESESEETESIVSVSASEMSDNESIMEDDQDEQPQQSKGARPLGAAMFLKGAAVSDSDEDSEDEKRVVKSAKDKRFDELRANIKSLNNARKINDWVAIQNEFDKLLKSVSKSTSLFTNGKIPRFVIRTLAQLSDSVKDTLENKNNIKKLNPSSAKALNAMKQKVRKSCKQYENEIEAFKLSPVTEDESASEAERMAEEAEMMDESEDEAAKKNQKVSFSNTTQVVDSDEEDASKYY